MKPRSTKWLAVNLSDSDLFAVAAHAVFTAKSWRQDRRRAPHRREVAERVLLNMLLETVEMVFNPTPGEETK